jgi:hypothetical protein
MKSNLQRTLKKFKINTMGFYAIKGQSINMILKNTPERRYNKV